MRHIFSIACVALATAITTLVGTSALLAAATTTDVQMTVASDDGADRVSPYINDVINDWSWSRWPSSTDF
jgi:hypothetical protein